MTQQSEVDSFFNTKPAESERVNGRYKFTDPFGQQVTATSASNYAFPLLDQYGLNKWRGRQLLKGLGKRPDLQAMLSVLDGDDVGKLDEIISTALEVAGVTEKANRGTAIHEALRLFDLGQSYPEWSEPYVQSYRAELLRYGLRVGLVETDVYSPGLGARGRLDRTYIEADGTHVLGDIKSTGHLELQAHEISVQLAIYQSATHIRKADGSWDAIPRGKHPLRDDYAIVVHVDQETASVALYRVDLWIGKRGAVLAEQVRQWRKAGPVLMPYVPPNTPAGGEVQPAPPSDNVLIVADAAASYTDENLAPWGLTTESGLGPTMTGPPTNAMTEADPMTAGIAAGMAARPDMGEALMNFAASVPVPVPDGRVLNLGDTPLKTATELQKMSKAQVQQYCRDHGITKDLSHHKAKLISMLYTAGKLAPDTGMGAQMKAEPTVHPAQTVAFRSTVNGKIRNAATVGDLELIRQDVVRTGGDQAWTDGMTEAARARVTELDASTAEAPVPVASHLDRVAACQTSQDLAKLWEELTVGGKVPGNWPSMIDQAAKARLEAITNARPPAPVNPFGQ